MARSHRQPSVGSHPSNSPRDASGRGRLARAGAGVVEALEGRTLLAADLYFAADNGATGAELFSYNGATTSLRANINPGSASSNPAELTAYNGLLYFRANDGSTGEELWRFNGTTASRAADINVGPFGASPEHLTVYNNKLYFAANDGPAGTELWAFDAATGAASRVADINTTAAGAGSDPEELHVHNGKLYFSATNGVAGRELWSYDSATGVVSMAADVRAGSAASSPRDLFAYGGALYFSATDGTAGRELWRFNGSAAQQVADLYAGATGSNPNELVEYNGRLYFSAEGSDGGGVELWRYDGSAAAPERVTDIYFVPGGNDGADSSPRNLTVYNNRLYFVATDSGGTSFELYSYDSTDGAVILIQDLAPGFMSASYTDLEVFNGRLYFGADANGGLGSELYRYDVAAPPITLVANINPTSGGSSTPRELAVFGVASPPSVTAIPDQAVLPNAMVGPLAFTVGDDSPAASLVVTASTSNPALFPPSLIAIGGSGANRTISLQPVAGQLGSATVSISVSDGEFTAGTSFVITVTNTPNNNAPVLSAGGGGASLDPVQEDEQSPAGLTVVQLIGRLGAGAITDADAGALKGIAVTGADNRNGQWQFSLDGGSSWTNFGPVTTASARLLPAADAARVRFVPAANFNGTVNPGITFRAWDQTSGAAGQAVNVFPNGGRTAFSVDAATASITVNAVNDAPDAVDDAVATDRLFPVTFDPRANDTDAEGPPAEVIGFHGSLVSINTVRTLPSGARVTYNGNDQTFTYDPNGAFNNLAPNATAADSFTYVVRDAGGLTDLATVRLTITNHTIVVNTTAGDDDGETINDVSLREAINLANNETLRPGHDTIVLAGGATYTLGAALPYLYGPTGLPSITSSIAVAGNGATIERSSAANTPAFRLFAIDAGARLRLEGLTLRNGLAKGGDGGSGAFGGGGGAGLGGGIFNAGDLRVLNTTFVANQAVGGRGGNGNTGAPGGGGGGGIGANGGSAATQGGGGGGGNVTPGTERGNRGGHGGGTVGSGGTNGQSAGGLDGGTGNVGGGGGANGTGSASGGDGGHGALGGGGGGGGSSNAGPSNGDGGHAGFGAGGGGAGLNYASGRATGGNGGFGGGAGGGQAPNNQDLSAGYGTPGFGGGKAPPFQGGDVQAGGGGAGMGGGLFNLGGNVTLLNATFSANAAVGGRGGTTPGFNGVESSQGAAYGAGVFTRNGTLTVVNSTFSDNLAHQGGYFGSTVRPEGGAIFALGDGAGQASHVAVHNSILANSYRTGYLVFDPVTGGTAEGREPAPDYATQIVNGGTWTVGGRNNILESHSGDRPSGVAVDPMLQPLAYNGTGALVPTHAPLPGSPAVEAGHNERAREYGLTTDARGPGFGRILDTADPDAEQVVDIGAFELNPTIGSLPNLTTAEDTPVTVDFEVGDGFTGIQSVTVLSSNTFLVPVHPSNLTVSGSGNKRRLTVTPAGDRSGATTIVVTLVGPGGTFATGTFNLTVTAANDAPVLNTTGSPKLPDIPEDAGPTGGFRVRDLIRSDGTADLITDVDDGAVEGIAVVGVDTAYGPWEFTTDDGATWQPLPAPAGAARLLADAPGTFVRLTPAANFNGTIHEALTFRAWDRTAGTNGQAFPITATGGATAFSTAVETASIHVRLVNDGAPVLNNAGSPSLAAIREDDTGNNGTSVADLLDSAGLDGPIITDPDDGDPRGIAVTAADAAAGSWQFSRDGGATWAPLLPAAGSSRLLNDHVSNRIRLVPAANFNGTVAAGLTFRAWDFSTGRDGDLAVIAATGGTTAYSAAAETASITVNAVNDAPTLDALADAVLGANAAPQAVSLAGITAGGGEAQAMTVTATSSNPALIPHPTVTYSSPAATGSMTYAPVAGASGKATITVTVRDNGGTAGGGADTTTRTFTVTVLPPPVVTAARFDPAKSSVSFRFSHAVTGLVASSLRLADPATGRSIDGGAVLTWDAAAAEAVWTFPGLPGGRLADGNYRATLARAGIHNLVGTPLAADYTFDFFQLGGDANRDRQVDVADLGILATAYGRASGSTWADGDFNGDGRVDVADLGILATNYGKAVPPPPAPTALAAAPAPAGAGPTAVTAEPPPPPPLPALATPHANSSGGGAAVPTTSPSPATKPKPKPKPKPIVPGPKPTTASTTAPKPVPAAKPNPPAPASRPVVAVVRPARPSMPTATAKPPPVTKPATAPKPVVPTKPAAAPQAESPVATPPVTATRPKPTATTAPTIITTRGSPPARIPQASELVKSALPTGVDRSPLASPSAPPRELVGGREAGRPRRP